MELVHEHLELPHVPPTEAESQGFLMLRGLIFPLSRQRDFVLGRDKGHCDLVLAHEHISKRHAIISYRGGRYFIRDLGSLNGTFVNGERVNGISPLVAGDEIRMPPYMMLFFGPDQVAPARTVKSASLPGITTEHGKDRGTISGLLSILSVTDVIQLLNFTDQGGTLTLRTPNLTIGEMTFSKGEIVSARYGGKNGEEAVYAMLRIHSGEFEFVQGNPPVPARPIERKTLSLLLEGSRLLDESDTQDAKQATEKVSSLG